ncbi:ATP-binding cassette domain-containing protein, partial [Chryseobacterium sp.]|uniref:ATP-binding cassette domain-containing protein n=1 Tax=Chryseobacterium sp. TaxID=1871047 RepID=UPI0035C773EC
MLKKRIIPCLDIKDGTTVKGINFEVQAGTRVGIIGRTGSGKSTLFQSLFRFIEAEEGEILIDNENV